MLIATRVILGLIFVKSALGTPVKALRATELFALTRGGRGRSRQLEEERL